MWRWAAITGIPFAALIVAWCVVPRPYYTGTDGMAETTLSSPIVQGKRACVSGLRIPAGTRRMEIGLASGQRQAAIVHATVRTSQGVAHTETIGPFYVGSALRVPLSVPRLPAGAASVPATLCLRSSRGTFAVGATIATSWLGGQLQIGHRTSGYAASIWYRPAPGARRSYLDELGTMAVRAARFAPGYARPWLFWVVVLGVLPLIALLSIRLLALAVAGRTSVRRLALGLFVIGVLNGASWAVITPAFQSPDELDHYAYTETLVTQGHKPSPYIAALHRWSTAELDALNGSGFFGIYQRSGSRAPGLAADLAIYRARLAGGSPSRSDGGGYQTTASYGPLYYYAVAPGYLLGGSPFSRLGAMRLCSALLGALAGVFALLAMLELVPSRLGLAVLAGLVVELEPLYGFLSGAVNNDIGVDVGAAAVLYLLLRLVRRGLPPPLIVALGALLGALPWVKSSAYELWVLSIVALALALWRGRRRAGVVLGKGLDGLAQSATTIAASLGAIAALLVFYLLCRALNTGLTPAPPLAGALSGATTSSTGAATGTVQGALAHLGQFLTYLWEVLFPALPGMAHYLPATGEAGELIFIRRGWGGFGWYDVFFPWWVYRVIEVALGCALLLGLRGLWLRRRTIARWWPQVTLLALFPIVVFVGFESAFWTTTPRTVVAEMGRYEFTALAALGALGVGALLGLPRRLRLPVATGMLSAFVALSTAAHLLVFTAFFS